MSDRDRRAGDGDAIDDAVLLLGGSGSRLGRLTEGFNKHMLPVYDRTLAGNALDWLVGLGCRRVAVVASPRDVPSLFPSLERSSGPDTRLLFVPQPEPAGTGDAVLRALKALQAQQVLALFGDNVFVGKPDPAAVRELSPGADVRIYLRWTEERLEHFSVAHLHGSEVTLDTRPHSYTSGYAVTGFFAIRTEALLDYHQTPPHARLAAGQEDDLIDFVAFALNHGRAEAERVTLTWHDAGCSYEALWEAGRSVRRAVLAG